jgi:hypothetical protein
MSYDYTEYWKCVGPPGPQGPDGCEGSFDYYFYGSSVVIDTSSNPYPMDISGNPLNFTLLFFDEKMFLDVSGVLFKSIYDPSFTTYDAIANVDVSFVQFRNMFAIQSDSNKLVDLSYNTSLDNVHFIVYTDAIGKFTPNIGANSVVKSGSIQQKSSLGYDISQNVKDDFIRYLAYLLFNTPYASELFINQQELVESAQRALDSAWDLCKKSLLTISSKNPNQNSNQNSNLIFDASGDYWYLDDSTESDINGKGVSNICGELYKQIASRAPERFINTNTLEVANGNHNTLGGNQYYLPLIIGDVITIRITLNASQSQELFGMNYKTRPGSFDPLNNQYLKPKTYLIQMRLV